MCRIRPAPIDTVTKIPINLQDRSSCQSPTYDPELVPLVVILDGRNLLTRVVQPKRESAVAFGK